MPSTKVENSKSPVKNEIVELEKVPSKFTIRRSDVIILGASFVFTILVAGSLLFYINNNHQWNANEIEKIVENILDARAAKLAANQPHYFERKRGYLEEVEDHRDRSKRSIDDYRQQTNGKLNE